MLKYDVLALALPPIIKDGKFQSLMAREPYASFIMSILEVIAEVEGLNLLVFDIVKATGAKSVLSTKESAAMVVKFFTEYKRYLSNFENPLSIIYSTESTKQAVIVLAEHINKFVLKHDIAIFNVDQPREFFKENKKIITYAVGSECDAIHVENILKYQPVGPLYGSKDLLRAENII